MVTAEKLQTYNLLHKLVCVCPCVCVWLFCISELLAVRACSTRAENVLRQWVSRKLGAQRGFCVDSAQGRVDRRSCSWITFLSNNFPLWTENPLFYGYKAQLWSEWGFGNHALNRQKNIPIRNQWEYCVQKIAYVILETLLIRTFDYSKNWNAIKSGQYNLLFVRRSLSLSIMWNDSWLLETQTEPTFSSFKLLEGIYLMIPLKWF